jgi:hypothetical protein
MTKKIDKQTGDQDQVDYGNKISFEKIQTMIDK